METWAKSPGKWSVFSFQLVAGCSTSQIFEVSKSSASTPFSPSIPKPFFIFVPQENTIPQADHMQSNFFSSCKKSFCVPCPHHHHCSQAQGKVALTQFLGKPYSCINGSRKCPEFYVQTRKKWGRWGFQAKLVKNWETRQIWRKLEILWPERKEMPVQFSPNIVSHLLTLCLIK